MRLFRRGEGASTLDLLVAGLGNPGREYAATRHNVGWLVVDELAARHDGSWRSKFSGQLAEIRLDDRRLGLLKPETYMNESGRSIGAAVRFFKVDSGALLVVHDDVDLEEGRLQARLGGGLAGHNGLRSIAQVLGVAGVPPAAHRRRPAGPRRSAVGRRLRAVRVRPGRRRRRARLPVGGRGRDDCRGMGSRLPSSASTDGLARPDGCGRKVTQSARLRARQVTGSAIRSSRVEGG